MITYVSVERERALNHILLKFYLKLCCCVGYVVVEHVSSHSRYYVFEVPNVRHVRIVTRSTNMNHTRS